ncbi:hypothetical protein [Sulfuracidifex metallicus]|uniref:Uncharacterized protein n=1 Tax=Sulfuracidifex metallicus DSM 6482 = JCM 9184 TaxID=523847 RepID=A0A6A9QLX0_SULME|nr:hypothetical protein [Sulfuracidifex metallicus]MUN28191.1 hypothetical protein [Sulfuracidifex metallicus DSM 6482 = JCM 9184]WOE51274.1 hypothetical protein RQ359_000545 [Sulfuracidifex metallicus DSM 6482 = JCM 9184]
MNEECYIILEGKKCVEICGRVICDEETVKSYVEICEKCKKGDRKACATLYERFGCMSISGWWI